MRWSSRPPPGNAEIIDMATEYKCDICGAHATVHITKIVDGKKLKVHLCESCAKKASFEALHLPAELFPKLQKLEQNIIENLARAEDGRICRSCGASLEGIEKGERFSCPDCYAHFGQEKLFELFSQLHSATRHRGKSPKFHSAPSGRGGAGESAGESASSGADSPAIGGGARSEGDSDGGGEGRSSGFESGTFESETAQSGASAEPGGLAGGLVSAAAADGGASPQMPASGGKDKLPKDGDSREALMRKLNLAISDERYEDAAKIRDMLKAMSAKP